MALSTLNASLPALEDLIALNLHPPSPPRPTPKTPIPKTPIPKTPKKIGSRLTRDIRRDILLRLDASLSNTPFDAGRRA
jgi:hypothetical protein